MKKMKCIHPRRAVNLMKAFINEASDLVTNHEYQEIINMDGDILDWEFGEPYIEEEKSELFVRKGDSFKVISPDCAVEDYDEQLVIYYNFDQLFTTSVKVFRGCWTQIFSQFKGFADVTISLLHELGHLETHNLIRDFYPIENRIADLEKIAKTAENYSMASAMYFCLPDESAATEWANAWLSVPENRKLAKTFEKKFFACFAED